MKFTRAFAFSAATVIGLLAIAMMISGEYSKIEISIAVFMTGINVFLGLRNL